jgi:hypothetical protein
VVVCRIMLLPHLIGAGELQEVLLQSSILLLQRSESCGGVAPLKLQRLHLQGAAGKFAT